MELKDLRAVCVVLLLCVASTLARFLNDTQNENSSIQDYGTQNPGQQLSKDPECDCEWRYLKHYEAKGCRPVYEEKPDDGKSSCTCPWRFDCSQADEVNADDKACVYKKHVYPVGSKIPTTNTCEQCSCTTDYFTQAATITCITTECPSVYSQTPLPEGCHYVYKEKECCPTSVECPAKEKENTYKVPICEYKGKMYYEGEQIYPDEDPCLICLCSSNWTGINSTSCRQHDCMLERDSRKLKQGCIPIYHEKTCCPIDYHCSDDDFEFKVNRGSNFKSEDDEDEMCNFEGRYYPIGHVLDIKHPTHCVTCTCKTPPDFTCIHSSCPPPPNGDYTHCRAVYKPNACCPDYKCHEKKEDVENPKSEEETTEEPSEDSLQILIQECKKMECASNERCMLAKKKCDGKKCPPVPQCEKVSFGCGQKSCPEGCEEIGSYENSCPICYCKKELKESQYKLTCHVQSCEENCILTGRDQDGCPLCKCPQGNLEERACAQSSCKGYNCTMIVNALGCAECRCQLSCKPRECPAGCDMDLDVPRDSGLECGCTCKNSTTALEFIHSKALPDTCKLVSCEGLNCTVGEDQSGCPTCTCKSPCPEPECQEGCQVEKDVEPGRCPGCVCKLSRSARDTEHPPGEGVASANEESYDEPEKREDHEADFIPMPGKEIVPGVDDTYLIHGEGDQYGNIPGYHYNADHAFSEAGEHLESALYNSDEKGTEKLENDHHEEFSDDLHEEASEDKHTFDEYDDDRYDHAYAEEKTLDDEEDGKCAQKNCPEGQKCVIRRLQCIRTPCPTIPVCIDVEPRCPIPMCSIGCMVMKWDDEVCPSCFCGIIRGAEGRVCPRTRCIGQRCYNVIGDDGCPTCKCDSICIPPTCDYGCWIETDPPEGKCPTCTCPQRGTVVPPIIPASPTAEAYGLKKEQSPKVTVNPFASYHCPTPHCNGYNCSLIRGSDGCQKCVCDSPCAPCPQHCVKTKTLSEGRCPICDCTAVASTALSESAHQCPLIECGGTNCRKVRDNNGCYTCICDPQCAEPKCDPGCEVLTNVPPGQCPGCVCRVTVVQAVVNRPKGCPAVQCTGPQCRTTLGPNGCLQCICDTCPPPKCDPGCELQTDVAQGQCPTCVCPTFNDDDADQEEEPYCPNLFCADYGCREVPGPAGCPICMCDPICATPVCEPGCTVVTNKHLGKCPVCICTHASSDNSSYSLDGIKSPQQQQPVTFSADAEGENETEPTEEYVHEEEETTTPTPTTTTTTTTTCSAPVCSGLRCSYETGEDGCEVCKCRYKCPTPKCVGNCYAETNAPPHRCPGCVCPSRRKPPSP